MAGLRSSTWRLRVWLIATLVVVMTRAAVVEGVGHHHEHPLGLNSRLNMMVDRVDASIWEKKRRMGGGHSYAPDEHDDDGVTIVESVMEEEEETHPEDMQDYVNNAPWTRRTQHRQPVNIINMQMIKMAAENNQRVKLEGKCEVPQQRCEAIHSPKHSKDTAFMPRCALLHRCSEDSGCCLSDDKVCGPAETETVELFFYAFADTRAKIEVMTFVNHTRCACRSRNIIPNSMSCKCPRNYSPTPVDGQCTCDCDISLSKCRRYKRGRRYFSFGDAHCVSTSECVAPTCEYGPFLAHQRRCTKRRERERYITTNK